MINWSIDYIAELDITYFNSLIVIQTPQAMQKRKRLKLRILLIHLLLWILYIISEMVANTYHYSIEDRMSFFYRTLLNLPILIIPTYFLIFFAVPKYLKQNESWKFSIIAILTAIFIFYFRIKWMEWMNYVIYHERFKIPASKVIKNIIRDYSIIALAVSLHIIGDWRKKFMQNKLLIEANAEAEIQLLKGQLHPHFLFNTLNNIYSLSLLKSKKTGESILKLTSLLDYLVYKVNQDQVKLSKEVELLENYIALEKLRYGDSLMIATKIDIQDNHIQIAPLLLLPFAENCFKHGGKDEEGIFKVEIELEEQDQKLDFSIRNTKQLDQGIKLDNKGIGLDNLQKRLSLLYPEKYSLKIEDELKYFFVHLKVNLA